MELVAFHKSGGRKNKTFTSLFFRERERERERERKAAQIMILQTFSAWQSSGGENGSVWSNFRVLPELDTNV
jgi:hypothetical protein